jgi:hypothetical protein
MKQETLEEFIIREGYPVGSQQEIWEDGVRNGYKLAQERMYSEEEVIQLVEDFKHHLAKCPINEMLSFKEWFEQFKKK